MDFCGFSSDSFEQLINALSVKVFGAGTSIFGNGPDGGREATFNGKVNYPSDTKDAWDGYGVVQAKFKERLEDTKKDFTWAKSQLKRELDTWVESEKRNPKPDYFIFCTNVELTSPNNGGKDKLNKLIEDYKKPLGLKGYAIWDFDKLISLIDGEQEIRTRFTAFFTPGDLLAQISKMLQFKDSTSSLLSSYIRNEFVNEQAAKTGQGGDRTEAQINLADVFMDLPSSERMINNNDGRHSFSSLSKLLHSNNCKLDLLSLQNYGEGSDKEICSQFVFIGGPGSGKSTIGQFLSQMNRAALLERIPQHKLNSNILTSIRSIKSRCESSNLNWPKTPRYPFRIDLNQFAKVLAVSSKEGEINTLSKYLRNKISLDESIPHSEFLSWFSKFPTLVIFDGLDEVPSSSNREQVIQQIQSFLGDIREHEADVMILATTRPDGYQNEFDSLGVTHNYLLPLNKEQALKCSENYLKAKYHNTTQNRLKEDMDILKASVENPLIEKLMHSPLQITFMVTVVSAFGKPSETRWKLFNDYYSTIYTRELQKSVPPFGRVLKERQQDIDELHYSIGFILQHRSEFSGETNSELSFVEFNDLVTSTLEENGLTANDLTLEKDLLVGAAKERLVFLTSKKDGYLSFDVRSLQEYMASMAITNADSMIVIDRFKSMAASSYWRNTLIFSIGRFFSDSHFRKHRDKIRTLCDDLNRGVGDELARARPEYQFIKLGSILALEILESGTLGNTPSFIRNLTAIALELLEHPPLAKQEFMSRLAAVYSPIQSHEYETALQLWLNQKNPEKSLSAWVLVTKLREKGNDAAIKLIDQHWPEILNDSIAVPTYLASNNLLSTEEIDNLLVRHFNLPISEFISISRSSNFRAMENNQFNKINRLFRSILKRIEINISNKKTNDISDYSGICIFFNSVELADHDEFLSNKDEIIENKKNELEKTLNYIKSKSYHESWELILAIYDFVIKQDLESLNRVRNEIEKSQEHDFIRAIAPSILLIPTNKSGHDILAINNKLNIENIDFIEKKLETEDLSFDSLPNFKIGAEETNLLNGISNIFSSSKINMDVTNYIISLHTKELVKSSTLLKSILFHLARNPAKCSQVDIFKLNKAFIRFNIKLYAHSIPILQDEIIDSDKINEWRSFYKKTLSNVTNMYLHRNCFRDCLIDQIVILIKKHPEEDSLLKLIAFMLASGVKKSVCIDFIMENRLPDNNLKIYYFIIDFINLKYSKELKENLESIMLNSTTGDKNLLLSSFINNKVHNYEFIKLINIFIINLKAHDWVINARAKDLYIESIQSMESEFTEKRVSQLLLPNIIRS